MNKNEMIILKLKEIKDIEYNDNKYYEKVQSSIKDLIRKLSINMNSFIFDFSDREMTIMFLAYEGIADDKICEFFEISHEAFLEIINHKTITYTQTMTKFSKFVEENKIDNMEKYVLLLILQLYSIINISNLMDMSIDKIIDIKNTWIVDFQNE